MGIQGCKENVEISKKLEQIVEKEITIDIIGCVDDNFKEIGVENDLK